MDIEQWARVRRKVLVDGRSKRSVMSEEGLHWETLQKMLGHSRPPGYRRVKKRGRKIDAHVEWIRQVVDSDSQVPRKQRHTAKRIFERLQSERGYEGGYTAVKEVVQVKRHGRKIQRQVLDALRGSLHRFGAVRGTIITTGDFSKGTRDAAFESGAAPITLINGEKLIDLLIEHGIGVRKRKVTLLELDPGAFQANEGEETE